MSSNSLPLPQRIFVHILPFCLALFPAVNSSADDLPMAQPESVGVSSSRLDRLTKSMQRYIDSDKLDQVLKLRTVDNVWIIIGAKTDFDFTQNEEDSYQILTDYTLNNLLWSKGLSSWNKIYVRDTCIST